MLTDNFKFNDFLAFVFGHEIEHTTDKNNTTFANEGKKAYEDEAHKVDEKIIKEKRAKKKK